MKDLSIIVPVYNVEKYIRDCLDSLVNQTNSNYEIILVDDGSKDNSLSICQQYCDKYDFISCFHQSNQGPGAARNLGLKYAKAEYITFVDADDTVTNDYVETILKNMKSDLMFFNLKVVNPQGEKIGEVVVPEIKEGNDILDTIYSFITRQRGNSNFILTVNKCYRADIIRNNNLQYPIGIIHSEDEIFTLRYLCCINSMQAIPDYLYINYAWGSSAGKPIGNDEFSNIVSHQYELSNSFKHVGLREFLKTRWVYFHFKHYRSYRQSLQFVWEKLIHEVTIVDTTILRESFSNHSDSDIFYPDRRFKLFIILLLKALKLQGLSSIIMYAYYLIDSLWLGCRKIKGII